MTVGCRHGKCTSQPGFGFETKRRDSGAVTQGNRGIEIQLAGEFISWQMDIKFGGNSRERYGGEVQGQGTQAQKSEGTQERRSRGAMAVGGWEGTRDKGGCVLLVPTLS